MAWRFWPWKSPARRAEGLLRANLSSQQRADLRRSGHFFVTGGQSGLRYRVGPRETVLLLAPGHGFKPVGSFCVSPLPRLPVADVMLAHALSIQHDERSFCAVAVFYPCSKELWHGIIPVLRGTNMLLGTNYQNFLYYI